MRSADRFTALVGEGLLLGGFSMVASQGLSMPGIRVLDVTALDTDLYRVTWEHNRPADDNTTWVYQDNRLIEATSNTAGTFGTKPGERLHLVLSDGPLSFGPVQFPGVFDLQWPQVTGARRYELERFDAGQPVGETLQVLESGQPYYRREYAGLVDDTAYRIDVYTVSPTNIRSGSAEETTITMVTYPDDTAPTFTYQGGLTVRIA